MARFRLNSDIIGNFRKNENFHGHLINHQKLRLQPNFEDVGMYRRYQSRNKFKDPKLPTIFKGSCSGLKLFDLIIRYFCSSSRLRPQNVAVGVNLKIYKMTMKVSIVSKISNNLGIRSESSQWAVIENGRKWNSQFKTHPA